jgi:hypothetical protein
MISLLGLLRDKEDSDLIEADLQSEYGVDLVDFFRGKMTARKLLVYIRGLPGSSRISKKHGGPDSEWSRLEHFTADVIDLLQIINYNQATALQMKAKHPKRLKAPEPVERPSDTVRKLEEAKRPKKFASKQELDFMLAKKVAIFEPNTGQLQEIKTVDRR